MSQTTLNPALERLAIRELGHLLRGPLLGASDRMVTDLVMYPDGHVTLTLISDMLIQPVRAYVTTETLAGALCVIVRHFST